MSRGRDALGEAPSGLHGPNRLGGTSPIELLVFGRNRSTPGSLYPLAIFILF